MVKHKLKNRTKAGMTPFLRARSSSPMMFYQDVRSSPFGGAGGGGGFGVSASAAELPPQPTTFDEIIARRASSSSTKPSQQAEQGMNQMRSILRQTASTRSADDRPPGEIDNRFERTQSGSRVRFSREIETTTFNVGNLLPVSGASVSILERSRRSKLRDRSPSPEEARSSSSSVSNTNGFAGHQRATTSSSATATSSASSGPLQEQVLSSFMIRQEQVLPHQQVAGVVARPSVVRAAAGGTGTLAAPPQEQPTDTAWEHHEASWMMQQSERVAGVVDEARSRSPPPPPHRRSLRYRGMLTSQQNQGVDAEFTTSSSPATTTSSDHMEWNPNVLKESGGLVDPPTTEEELLRVLVPVEYPAKVAAAATNHQKNGKNNTKNADLGRRPPPPEQKAAASSSSTSSAHNFGVSSWASAAEFDFTQARDGVSSEDFADHVDDHAEQLAHRTFALAATPTPAALVEATEALPALDFLMHSVSSSGGRSEFEAGGRSEHQLTSSADEDRLLSSGGLSVDVGHVHVEKREHEELLGVGGHPSAIADLEQQLAVLGPPPAAVAKTVQAAQAGRPDGYAGEKLPERSTSTLPGKASASAASSEPAVVPSSPAASASSASVSDPDKRPGPDVVPSAIATVERQLAALGPPPAAVVETAQVQQARAEQTGGSARGRLPVPSSSTTTLPGKASAASSEPAVVPSSPAASASSASVSDSDKPPGPEVVPSAVATVERQLAVLGPPPAAVVETVQVQQARAEQTRGYARGRLPVPSSIKTTLPAAQASAASSEPAVVPSSPAASASSASVSDSDKPPGPEVVPSAIATVERQLAALGQPPAAVVETVQMRSRNQETNSSRLVEVLAQQKTPVSAAPEPRQVDSSSSADSARSSVSDAEEPPVHGYQSATATVEALLEQQLAALGPPKASAPAAQEQKHAVNMISPLAANVPQPAVAQQHLQVPREVAVKPAATAVSRVLPTNTTSDTSTAPRSKTPDDGKKLSVKGKAPVVAAKPPRAVPLEARIPAHVEKQGEEKTASLLSVVAARKAPVVVEPVAGDSTRARSRTPDESARALRPGLLRTVSNSTSAAPGSQLRAAFAVKPPRAVPLEALPAHVEKKGEEKTASLVSEVAARKAEAPAALLQQPVDAPPGTRTTPSAVAGRELEEVRVASVLSAKPLFTVPPRRPTAVVLEPPTMPEDARRDAAVEPPTRILGRRLEMAAGASAGGAKAVGVAPPAAPAALHRAEAEGEAAPITEGEDDVDAGEDDIEEEEYEEEDGDEEDNLAGPHRQPHARAEGEAAPIPEGEDSGEDDAIEEEEYEEEDADEEQGTSAPHLRKPHSEGEAAPIAEGEDEGDDAEEEEYEEEDADEEQGTSTLRVHKPHAEGEAAPIAEGEDEGDDAEEEEYEEEDADEEQGTSALHAHEPQAEGEAAPIAEGEDAGDDAEEEEYEEEDADEEQVTSTVRVHKAQSEGEAAPMAEGEDEGDDAEEEEYEEEDADEEQGTSALHAHKPQAEGEAAPVAEGEDEGDDAEEEDYEEEDADEEQGTSSAPHAHKPQAEGEAAPVAGGDDEGDDAEEEEYEEEDADEGADIFAPYLQKTQHAEREAAPQTEGEAAPVLAGEGEAGEEDEEEEEEDDEDAEATESEADAPTAAASAPAPPSAPADPGSFASSAPASAAVAAPPSSAPRSPSGAPRASSAAPRPPSSAPAAPQSSPGGSSPRSGGGSPRSGGGPPPGGGGGSDSDKPASSKSSKSSKKSSSSNSSKGSSKKSSSSSSGPTLGAAPARSSSSGGGVRASNRPSSPGGLKSSSAGPGYDASPFGAELKRVSNVDLRAPGKPRASTTANDSLGLEEDVAADDARFKGAKPTVSNPVAMDAAHPFNTQHQRHHSTPQQQRAQHYVGKADFFADGLKDRVVTDREQLRKGVRENIPDDRLKVIADFLESEKAKKLTEATRKKEKKKKAKKLQTYQQARAAYKKVKAAGKVVPQAVKAALAAGRNFKVPTKPAPLAKSYSKQYQQALSGWPKVGTKLYSLKRFAKKADDFEAELRELPQKDANRILPQQDYAGISILGDGMPGDAPFLRVMKGSHGFKRSTLLGTPTVSLEDATPALRNGDKFVRGIRVNENLFSQIGHAAERGIQEFRRQIFTHVSGHTDVFNARERQRNYLEEEIGRMYSIPPFTPWDARSEFWFRGYAQEVKMNMVGAEERGVGFFQYDLRTVTGYRGVPENMFGRGPEAYLQAVAGLSGAEIAQMVQAGELILMPGNAMANNGELMLDSTTGTTGSSRRSRSSPPPRRSSSRRRSSSGGAREGSKERDSAAKKTRRSSSAGRGGSAGGGYLSGGVPDLPQSAGRRASTTGSALLASAGGLGSAGPPKSASGGAGPASGPKSVPGSVSALLASGSRGPPSGPPSGTSGTLGGATTPAGGQSDATPRAADSGVMNVDDDLMNGDVLNLGDLGSGMPEGLGSLGHMPMSEGEAAPVVLAEGESSGSDSASSSKKSFNFSSGSDSMGSSGSDSMKYEVSTQGVSMKPSTALPTGLTATGSQKLGGSGFKSSGSSSGSSFLVSAGGKKSSGGGVEEKRGSLLVPAGVGSSSGVGSSARTGMGTGVPKLPGDSQRTAADRQETFRRDPVDYANLPRKRDVKIGFEGGVFSGSPFLPSNWDEEAGKKKLPSLEEMARRDSAALDEGPSSLREHFYDEKKKQHTVEQGVDPQHLKRKKKDDNEFFTSLFPRPTELITREMLNKRTFIDDRDVYNFNDVPVNEFDMRSRYPPPRRTGFKTVDKIKEATYLKSHSFGDLLTMNRKYASQLTAPNRQAFVSNIADKYLLQEIMADDLLKTKAQLLSSDGNKSFDWSNFPEKHLASHQNKWNNELDALQTAQNAEKDGEEFVLPLTPATAQLPVEQQEHEAREILLNRFRNKKRHRNNDLSKVLEAAITYGPVGGFWWPRVVEQTPNPWFSTAAEDGGSLLAQYRKQDMVDFDKHLPLFAENLLKNKGISPELREDLDKHPDLIADEILGFVVKKHHGEEAMTEAEKAKLILEMEKSGSEEEETDEDERLRRRFRKKPEGFQWSRDMKVKKPGLDGSDDDGTAHPKKRQSVTLDLREQPQVDDLLRNVERDRNLGQKLEMTKTEVDAYKLKRDVSEAHKQVEAGMRKKYGLKKASPDELGFFKGKDARDIYGYVDHALGPYGYAELVGANLRDENIGKILRGAIKVDDYAQIDLTPEQDARLRKIALSTAVAKTASLAQFGPVLAAQGLARGKRIKGEQVGFDDFQGLRDEELAKSGYLLRQDMDADKDKVLMPRGPVRALLEEMLKGGYTTMEQIPTKLMPEIAEKLNAADMSDLAFAAERLKLMKAFGEYRFTDDVLAPAQEALEADNKFLERKGAGFGAMMEAPAAFDEVELFRPVDAPLQMMAEGDIQQGDLLPGFGIGAEQQQLLRPDEIDTAKLFLDYATGGEGLARYVDKTQQMEFVTGMQPERLEDGLFLDYAGQGANLAVNVDGLDTNVGAQRMSFVTGAQPLNQDTGAFLDYGVGLGAGLAVKPAGVGEELDQPARFSQVAGMQPEQIPTGYFVDVSRQGFGYGQHLDDAERLSFVQGAQPETIPGGYFLDMGREGFGLGHFLDDAGRISFTQGAQPLLPDRFYEQELPEAGRISFVQGLNALETIPAGVTAGGYGPADLAPYIEPELERSEQLRMQIALNEYAQIEAGDTRKGAGAADLKMELEKAGIADAERISHMDVMREFAKDHRTEVEKKKEATLHGAAISDRAAVMPELIRPEGMNEEIKLKPEAMRRQDFDGYTIGKHHVAPTAMADAQQRKLSPDLFDFKNQLREQDRMKAIDALNANYTGLHVKEQLSPEDYLIMRPVDDPKFARDAAGAPQIGVGNEELQILRPEELYPEYDMRTKFQREGMMPTKLGDELIEPLRPLDIRKSAGEIGAMRHHEFAGGDENVEGMRPLDYRKTVVPYQPEAPAAIEQLELMRPRGPGVLVAEKPYEPIEAARDDFLGRGLRPLEIRPEIGPIGPRLYEEDPSVMTEVYDLFDKNMPKEAYDLLERRFFPGAEIAAALDPELPKMQQIRKAGLLGAHEGTAGAGMQGAYAASVLPSGTERPLAARMGEEHDVLDKRMVARMRTAAVPLPRGHNVDRVPEGMDRMPQDAKLEKMTKIQQQYAYDKKFKHGVKYDQMKNMIRDEELDKFTRRQPEQDVKADMSRFAGEEDLGQFTETIVKQGTQARDLRKMAAFPAAVEGVDMTPLQRADVETDLLRPVNLVPERPQRKSAGGKEINARSRLRGEKEETIPFDKEEFEARLLEAAAEPKARTKADDTRASVEGHKAELSGLVAKEADEQEGATAQLLAPMAKRAKQEAKLQKMRAAGRAKGFALPEEFMAPGGSAKGLAMPAVVGFEASMQRSQQARQKLDREKEDLTPIPTAEQTLIDAQARAAAAKQQLYQRPDMTPIPTDLAGRLFDARQQELSTRNITANQQRPDLTPLKTDQAVGMLSPVTVVPDRPQRRESAAGREIDARAKARGEREAVVGLDMEQFEQRVREGLERENEKTAANDRRESLDAVKANVSGLVAKEATDGATKQLLETQAKRAQQDAKLERLRAAGRAKGFALPEEGRGLAMPVVVGFEASMQRSQQARQRLDQQKEDLRPLPTAEQNLIEAKARAAAVKQQYQRPDMTPMRTDLAGGLLETRQQELSAKINAPGQAQRADMSSPLKTDQIGLMNPVQIVPERPLRKSVGEIDARAKARGEKEKVVGLDMEQYEQRVREGLEQPTRTAADDRRESLDAVKANVSGLVAKEATDGATKQLLETQAKRAQQDAKLERLRAAGRAKGFALPEEGRGLAMPVVVGFEASMQRSQQARQRLDQQKEDLRPLPTAEQNLIEAKARAAAVKQQYQRPDMTPMRTDLAGGLLETRQQELSAKINAPGQAQRADMSSPLKTDQIGLMNPVQIVPERPARNSAAGKEVSARARTAAEREEVVGLQVDNFNYDLATSAARAGGETHPEPRSADLLRGTGNVMAATKSAKLLGLFGPGPGAAPQPTPTRDSLANLATTGSVKQRAAEGPLAQMLSAKGKGPPIMSKGPPSTTNPSSNKVVEKLPASRSPSPRDAKPPGSEDMDFSSLRAKVGASAIFGAKGKAMAMMQRGLLPGSGSSSPPPPQQTGTGPSARSGPSKPEKLPKSGAEVKASGDFGGLAAKLSAGGLFGGKGKAMAMSMGAGSGSSSPPPPQETGPSARSGPSKPEKLPKSGAEVKASGDFGGLAAKLSAGGLFGGKGKAMAMSMGAGR